VKIAPLSIYPKIHIIYIFLCATIEMVSCKTL
jgi:hypothetical protein